MPGHSSRHFSELTMSNNLQDILAAASGYQSVTSEPALNRKRPKTLDDYPVIPPASKKYLLFQVT